MPSFGNQKSNKYHADTSYLFVSQLAPIVKTLKKWLIPHDLLLKPWGGESPHFPYAVILIRLCRKK